MIMNKLLHFESSLWWCGALSLHVLSGAHHLVDEEELLGQDGCDVHELALDDVAVPHVGDVGGQRITRHGVDAVWLLVF